ncbi:MAG: hypothetical protein JO007_10530 [Alphaproteobacteria bacterium]|nr:hypothetical protein [Alphaproteobacteria bacterium]
MPVFRFFDPYTALAAGDNRPEEPAKAAKIAKADLVPSETLAGLATLAGADPVISAPPVAEGAAEVWGEAEDEWAATINQSSIPQA